MLVLESCCPFCREYKAFVQGVANGRGMTYELRRWPGATSGQVNKLCSMALWMSWGACTPHLTLPNSRLSFPW